MARVVLIAHRRLDARDELEEHLGDLNRALTPDNVEPRPPAFTRANGVSVAVFSPSGVVRRQGTSVAVGALFADTAAWQTPGAAVPDGSFALLRADSERVELVADATGSRTIWYVLLDDKLIASTSQRAIIALLGDFEFNRNLLPWMLSSGTLGGLGSWDVRLRQVGPGERIMLDRASWKVVRTAKPIEFVADTKLAAGAHSQRLGEAVERVCRDWVFDAEKWVLPLSGGTDSRGLLSLLRDRAGLRTITWGTANSRDEEGNDACIAGALAAQLGVPNRYFATDLSAEPRDRLVRRFLAAGEGRVAKISGYLDGFKIWKTLFEEGLDGIIRGDEAFGSMHVRNPYGARYTASLTLLTDYFRPNEIAAFDLPEQTMPAALERRSSESLAAWRDRLYQEFRVPNLLAALTDLKTAYVEVANPLLTRAVLECVRQLPDHMRTGKITWREFVRARSPAIPYASTPAVLALNDFVNDKSMLKLMLAEMESTDSREIFGPLLRQKVTDSIKQTLVNTPARKRVRPGTHLMRSLPNRMRLVARRWVTPKPSLHPMVFAFRAFVASRMNALMKADAAALHRNFGRAANL